MVACSALRRRYREALAAAAQQPLTFIHLSLPEAVLEERMRARKHRFMPASLLASQLRTLEPLAPDEDGTEIAESGTTEQTIEAIRHWLAQRFPGAVPDGLEVPHE